MSTRPRTDLAVLVAAALLWGCGDKVPESEAARRAGEQPKKVIDKAASDINQAIEKGTQRVQEEPK